MQPSSYYKQSRLAEPKRQALEWLAQQLRWERTLDQLRSERPEVIRKAA